ncbi:MAG: hypothetical protein ACF8MF_00880 [Phycisphaerales bacterium JB052]
MAKLDDRGQKVALREDPEGIHKPVDLRMRSHKRLKQYQTDPRICSVLYRRALASDVHEPRSALWRFFNLLAIVFVLVMISGSLAGTVFGDTSKFQVLPTIYTLLILLATGYMVRLVVNLIETPRQRRKAHQMMQKLKELPPHCAGCWYPLADQADEDGCAVCPECGGAWRVHG